MLEKWTNFTQKTGEKGFSTQNYRVKGAAVHSGFVYVCNWEEPEGD